MKVYGTCSRNDIKLKADAFRRGERNFTVEELREIKLYLQRLKDYVNSIQFYEGTLKDMKVISCFAEDFYSELHTIILDKFSASIAILVVLAEKKVLIKKDTQTCKINLCDLAKIICSGDCDEETDSLAYGEITSTFLKFSQTLIPC